MDRYRMMVASMLRVLEDEYLHVNNKRALTGDWASHYYWQTREMQVLDIMQQFKDIFDGF